jgi:hypothetical protein
MNRLKLVFTVFLFFFIVGQTEAEYTGKLFLNGEAQELYSLRMIEGVAYAPIQFFSEKIGINLNGIEHGGKELAGAVFVPLRAISQQLDIKIMFDTFTQSAFLFEKLNGQGTQALMTVVSSSQSGSKRPFQHIKPISDWTAAG